MSTNISAVLATPWFKPSALGEENPSIPCPDFSLAESGYINEHCFVIKLKKKP